MSESSSDPPDESDAARLVLEPDAVHEGDGEIYLDCPQCGSSVSVTRIIEEGHCPGWIDAEEAETQNEDTKLQEPRCTAELSLELVWKA